MKIEISKFNKTSYDGLNKDWKAKLSHWLGRVWSLCTSPLTQLIHRITRVTHSYFHQTPKRETISSSPTFLTKELSKFQKVEDKIPEEEILEEEEFIEEIEGLEGLFNEEIKSSSSFTSPPLSKDPQDENKIPEMIIKQENSRKQQTSDTGLTDQSEKKGNNPLDSISQTKFRRKTKALQFRNNKRSIFSSTTPYFNKHSHPMTSKIKDGFQIIEAGGGGDCQLHAFLKGLEIQYSSKLADYQENNKMEKLTALKLRQIGIAFARDQIDHFGPYTETVLGYLDSDRKEYNETKIAAAGLKREGISQTDEDFLEHLEKPGFYCSTLHLFALSIHFKLPIHVHDQYGVNNHAIQVFNPTDSKEDPIHLFRVRNVHYQLMINLNKL